MSLKDFQVGMKGSKFSAGKIPTEPSRSFLFVKFACGWPLHTPNIISHFIASGNGFLWFEHVDD